MPKNRRIDFKNLNQDYSGKNIQFSIKTTIGRKIKTLTLNETIENIKEDKLGYFVINLSKDYTYIKLTYKEATFFDKYEKLGKFIVETDETFKELTSKLRKI